MQLRHAAVIIASAAACACAIDLGAGAGAADDESVMLQMSHRRPEHRHPRERLLYGEEGGGADSARSLVAARRAEQKEIRQELAGVEREAEALTKMMRDMVAERQQKTIEIEKASATAEEISGDLAEVHARNEEARLSIEEAKGQLVGAMPALAAIPRTTEHLALKKAVDARDKELRAKEDQVRKIRIFHEDLSADEEQPALRAADARRGQALEALKGAAARRDEADRQAQLLEKETKRVSDLAGVMRAWDGKEKDELAVAQRLLTAAGVENDAMDLQLEMVKFVLDARRAEAGKPGTAALLQERVEAQDADEETAHECQGTVACERVLAGLNKQNAELRDQLRKRREAVANEVQRVRRDLGAAEREGQGLDELGRRLAERQAKATALKDELEKASSDLRVAGVNLKVLKTELAISDTWASKVHGHNMHTSPSDGGDFDMALLESSARTIVEKSDLIKAKKQELADAQNELDAAREQSMREVSAVDAETERIEFETAGAAEAARQAEARVLAAARGLGAAAGDLDQARREAGRAVRKEPVMNKGIEELNDLGYFEEGKDDVAVLTEAWKLEGQSVKEYESKKAELASLREQLDL